MTYTLAKGSKMTTSVQSDRHEHKGPQCHTNKDTICKSDACVRDHHISRHTEVSCTPVKGKADLYECVHTHKGLA